MSAIEQLKEMLELAGIKTIIESLTKPITEAVCEKLAEAGIEAEVKFDIEVKSVNLETFYSKGVRL